MAYTNKMVNGVRVALTPQEIAELEARDAAWAARPARVPEIISDRQFFQALALSELITQDEALAAVKTGSIPATLQALIDGSLSGNEHFAAEMLMSGAVEFHRSHPLVAALGAGIGWSGDQLDELWRTAAQM